jgi:hypothetical protein
LSHAKEAETWRPDFAASPLFTGLRGRAALFQSDGWPDLADLDDAARRLDIVNTLNLPIRFVHQRGTCGQRQYEDGIHASGCVPTRQASWHDFFNALIWLAWPRAKAALNETQHQALQTAPAGRRGALSDAATLFDESGLVLVTDDPDLPKLLSGRQWRAALWERRADWQSARLYVFGHSLLEKDRSHIPGNTGRCLWIDAKAPLDSDDVVPSWLDEAVAERWLGGSLTGPGVLFPVPVYGIPGHNPSNTCPEYYENSAVFRPPRLTT